MSLPSQAEYVIVGAGIHGLSTAWRLAERLTAAGESVEGRIVIVDKADRIARELQVLLVELFVTTIFSQRCVN